MLGGIDEKAIMPESVDSVVTRNLAALKRRRGLPLSIRMYEASRLGGEELFTLAALAGPLAVWRGRLCYQYEDALDATTLNPAWILYKTDEDGVSADLAEMANRLKRAGELIQLPEVHFPEVLNRFAENRDDLLPQARANCDVLTGLYSQLISLDQIPVSPLAQATGNSSPKLTAILPLPVVFHCSAEAYSAFTDRYSQDLTRLRHALRDVFKASQAMTREEILREIAQELDYQIARLNTLYDSATKDRVISGAGVAVGSVITALSFVLPPEMQPFLIAVGTPSTLFSGLKWLGQRHRQESACKESDYYLAWKFQTK